MIRFRCPHCSTRCTAPLAAAGKAVKCPGCKARLEVPFSDTDSVASASVAPSSQPDLLPVVNLPNVKPDARVPTQGLPSTKGAAPDYDQKLLDDVAAFLKAQGASEEATRHGDVAVESPGNIFEKERAPLPKGNGKRFLALGAAALFVVGLGVLAVVFLPFTARRAGTKEKEREVAFAKEPKKDTLAPAPTAKQGLDNVDVPAGQDAAQAKDAGKRPAPTETAPLPTKTPETSAEVDKPPKEPERQPITTVLPKLAAKASSDQIYERALKSVVWINNPGMGSGSGTLINAVDKLVLTNYHVVVQANRATAATNVRHSFKGTLTKSDRRDASTSLPYKLFDVQLTRGQYIFEMESDEIDCYFGILTSANQPLVYSVKGKDNASVYFSPPSDGKYKIMAMSKSVLGGFNLTVSEIDPKATPSGAWSLAPHLIVNFPEYKGSEVIADKGYYLRINSAAGVKRKAKIVAHSEAKDLAVLKLDYLPAGVTPMPLSKIRGKPAQLAHSVGNPGGSGALWVYTSGTVRTAPYHRDWKSSGAGGFFNHSAMVIETQSPTNPGDSGGPLFNDSVEMVAVTQGGIRSANSISFFVDVEEVRSFLRGNRFTWVEN